MAKTDIFIVGVGGQGSLSASWFLGEAANTSDLKVLVGEVHGMAQRGGVVESTVRIGDVHGPIIADGSADVLLGFEPVETLRFLHKASKDTMVITNTHRIVPANVSMQGASYLSLEEVLEKVKTVTEKVIAIDATDIATKAGTAKAVNAVMMGALTGAGVLPMKAEVIKEAVLSRVPPKVKDVNEKAFDAGVEFVQKNPV